MRKQLEDYIDHVHHTVDEMSDRFQETNEFQERSLTIKLEGKEISFPIAYDTYEILIDLLREEQNHYTSEGAN